MTRQSDWLPQAAVFVDDVKEFFQTRKTLTAKYTKHTKFIWWGDDID